MLKKNLVYFGSPSFSAQILSSIIDSQLVNVVGVVTQPDKPQGRHSIITPSPVAITAQNLNLPTYKPLRLDDANLTHIKLLKPDIFLVVSFGKIFPLSWIEAPQIGTFNIHFSLLPKYRGALCISEAIKNQDPVTGVTLMKMAPTLDSGPIISQQKVSIDNSDDTATLTTKLTQQAIQLLAEKLPEICAQNYHLLGQDESLATFTPKTTSLTKKNAFVPYETLLLGLSGQDAAKTSSLIRSLTPEPGAWTKIDQLEIKIIKTHLEKNNLVIDQVQLSGKNPILWSQFVAGHPNIKLSRI